MTRFPACAVLVAFGLAGCTSNKPEYLPQQRSGYSAAESPGSIADINRKRGGNRPNATQPRSSKTDPVEIVLFVAHDAAGKPLYAETRRSSGDSALDRRAQEFVLRTQRFPAGKADTVLITVDPKRVPRR